MRPPIRVTEGVFSDDDLLPLSGLQHLEFCERQWALIHTEQVWAENRLTAEGRVLHEHVHEGGEESRREVIISRGLPVRSLRLGLSGQIDVVEFHRVEREEPGGTAVLAGRPGWWQPWPVEYKRGRPKGGWCDEVQLCAQAMCLEEMLSARVPRGALFYGAARRRKEIAFTAELRRRTESLSARMHELRRRGETPGPVYGKHCENCSLREVCLPRAVESAGPVAGYIRQTLSGGE